MNQNTRLPPRWCACYDRNALFSHISNMAEDSDGASEFSGYVCFLFPLMLRLFLGPKVYHCFVHNHRNRLLGSKLLSAGLYSVKL